MAIWTHEKLRAGVQLPDYLGPLTACNAMPLAQMDGCVPGTYDAKRITRDIGLDFKNCQLIHFRFIRSSNRRTDAQEYSKKAIKEALINVTEVCMGPVAASVDEFSGGVCVCGLAQWMFSTRLGF